MSAGGLRPLAPGAGVISGGHGYGRGSGVNPNAMVLWDRDVFLHPIQGISEKISSQSRSISHVIGIQSTATTSSTGMVTEQAGVVFSVGSNGRLRNQTRHDGYRHVRFDNSHLQDGVVQDSVSQLHGSVSMSGRVLCNQGDGISPAILMENASNRVSIGIRRRVDDPQRMVATTGVVNLLNGGIDQLSHVGSSSGVVVNFATRPLSVSKPVTEMDHQAVSAVDGVAKKVLERSHLDIGKFLGFSSMETGVSPAGNNPGDKSVPSVAHHAPAGMSRYARKHGRWQLDLRRKASVHIQEGRVLQLYYQDYPT
ncbi:hypothetical protein NE237_032390 [Protea cynaroides]|uniref:Uncharacterized protein n=1 Tax=Protea cynaroides TaxID=273540 RepID=A0A9Q0R319_9MAGN|nr:hypothetical protein NE237_032390 [Protea cynaroides]